MNRSRLFGYFGLLSITTIMLALLTMSWVFFIGAISSLSIFVVASKTLPPAEVELKISREDNEKEVYVGDEVEVTINIENKGKKLRFLEVHDILPSITKVEEGMNHQILEMNKYEKKQWRYKISCPVTGKIKIGPIKGRYRDALNLFSKKMGFEEEMEIRVLPDTEEMKSVDVEPKYTKHWLGNTKSKNIGLGSEFFSLREYHPGDEFKDINWKATARRLSPITNAYEGEKSGDIILVVDGYEKGVVGTFEYNTLEVSINAAASLASSSLSNRNRVGLIVMGDYLNWVYPGTGKNQFHKIMDNLTKLKSGGYWELENVKWLIKNFFPRRCTIIFISPLTVPEFGETIIDLCMEEYDMMVISPNPVKIEKEVIESHEEHDEVAENLNSMERELILDELWKYGMVVDWDPMEPLEPKLEEVIKYQKKMRKA